MARVLITGSSEGLGLMAGEVLAKQGHAVTLHARNAARAADARRALPGIEGVVIGDVSTLAAMRDVADQANATGRFDAVIHNVAIGYHQARRAVTSDGLEQHFAINVLAPYVLTARMTRSARLVYLSSGMHQQGDADLADLQWEHRRWNGMQAYSTTKLLDVMIAFAVARRWPDVVSNAVEPGWVPTRMGGAEAPDDLARGSVTQAWLAVSDDAAARVSGRLFFHQKERKAHPAASDVRLQDALLDECAKLSGVTFPVT